MNAAREPARALRLLFFAGFFLTALGAGAAPAPVENAEKYNLPPGVKVWEQRKYREGQLSKVTLWAFDEQGTLTSKKVLDAAGKPYVGPNDLLFFFEAEEDPDIRYENVYEKGQLVSQTARLSTGKTTRHEYRYEGGRIAQYLRDGEWFYRYTYTDAGNLKEETLFHRGVHEYTERSGYDDTGRLTATHFVQHQMENADRDEVFSYTEGRLARSVRTTFHDSNMSEYFYDSSGRLERLVHTYVNPFGQSNTFVYRYSYNSQNLKVRETIENQIGGVPKVWTLEYEYESGLLSKRTSERLKEWIEYRTEFY